MTTLLKLAVSSVTLFLNLSWLIESDYNTKILITFHGFDLELSKSCVPYDYVKVSDMCNKAKTWSKNPGTGDNVDGYCGSMSKFSVTSRCEKVRVEFKSDNSITGKGFNATYEALRSLRESQNNSNIFTYLTSLKNRFQVLLLRSKHARR